LIIVDSQWNGKRITLFQMVPGALVLDELPDTEECEAKIFGAPFARRRHHF
jgi:hypothetical protein